MKLAVDGKTSKILLVWQIAGYGKIAITSLQLSNRCNDISERDEKKKLSHGIKLRFTMVKYMGSFLFSWRSLIYIIRILVQLLLGQMLSLGSELISQDHFQSLWKFLIHFKHERKYFEKQQSGQLCLFYRSSSYPSFILFYFVDETAWFASIHLLQPEHFRKHEQKDVDFSSWSASAEFQV